MSSTTASSPSVISTSCLSAGCVLSLTIICYVKRSLHLLSSPCRHYFTRQHSAGKCRIFRRRQPGIARSDAQGEKNVNTGVNTEEKHRFGFNLVLHWCLCANKVTLMLHTIWEFQSNQADFHFRADMFKLCVGFIKSPSFMKNRRLTNTNDWTIHTDLRQTRLILH